MLPETASALTTAEAIKVIRDVGSEGGGNAEAAAAWRQLVGAKVPSILEILKGMDDASPLALNWLRSAVDTIVARRGAEALPVSELEDFLGRTSHHPRARRLAYELIAQADPGKAEGLIGSMLDDPSTELRRDAVGRVLLEAEARLAAGHREEALGRYERALRSARDVDQIETIAKKLEELGHPVQLGKVFGWLTEWRVIGPFDSSKGVGFERVFPPEEELNFAADYEGKNGQVRWQTLTVANPYGMVDLNKPLGALTSTCSAVKNTTAASRSINTGSRSTSGQVGT
jgi:hypothetical protein